MLVLMIGTMALGRFSADIIMMGVLLVLLIAGVLEPVEAIGGFAHPGVITVAMLYVVAAAMKETGAMSRITSVLLGRPKSERSAQVKLTLPVAVMSAAAGRAGGIRAQTMLRTSMTSFNVRFAPASEVAVASSYQEFEENGQLKSEHYQASLTRLMNALRGEISGH